MRHRTPTAAHPAVAGLGTVLGVWAHPDDEAYLSAGLMATARAAGQRVVAIFATAGQAGTDDPARWPPDLLARRRRRELAASLAILGVAEHHVADFVDGACADARPGRGPAWVRRWVDRARPQTVVTFGPDGMTGHPDHRAVSGWVGEALATLARPPRLLHATVTPGFHQTWGRLNDELGLWGGEPPCTPADDLALVVECRGALLDRKLAALRAHRSQTAPLEAAIGTEAFRRWWADECFVEAVPGAPAARPAELVGAGLGGPG